MRARPGVGVIPTRMRPHWHLLGHQTPRVSAVTGRLCHIWSRKYSTIPPAVRLITRINKRSSCGSISIGTWTTSSAGGTGYADGGDYTASCQNIHTTGNWCQTVPMQDEQGAPMGETIFVAASCCGAWPIGWCYQQPIYIVEGVSNNASIYNDYVLSHENYDLSMPIESTDRILCLNGERPFSRLCFSFDCFLSRPGFESETCLEKFCSPGVSLTRLPQKKITDSKSVKTRTTGIVPKREIRCQSLAERHHPDIFSRLAVPYCLRMRYPTHHQRRLIAHSTL